MNCFYKTTIATPLGTMVALARDTTLHMLKFEDDKNLEKVLKKIVKNEPIIDASNIILDRTKKELLDYFNKKLKNFSIPLQLYGTDFQKSCWQILQTIAYGKTISYIEQAHHIKNIRAQRAVGSANGNNHIAIIIPCHRVIRADKHLGGYASGLDRKQALLLLESSSQ